MSECEACAKSNEELGPYAPGTGRGTVAKHHHVLLTRRGSETAALRDIIVACDRTLLNVLSELMGYVDGADRPIQREVRAVLGLTRPIAEAEIARRALEAKPSGGTP